jgi:signal transduction histidine kinase/ActR/RegA family two-component response regulator
MSTDLIDSKSIDRHLEIQLAVSRLLGRAPSDDVLVALLQTLGEGLNWQLGEVWTLDRALHRLRRIAVWHAPGLAAPHLDAASVGVTFGPQEGVPGRVWATRAPVWIDDVTQDHNLPRATAADDDGLHACCAFPAVVGEEVAAVLQFFASEVRPPDRTLLLLTASIGMLVGAFLERSRTGAAAEALRAGQQRILSWIASGRPVADVLTEIVHVVEAQSPGMLGSIVLLDADGVHLRHAAAPSLPPAYVASIDGAAIGDVAGSCGTAMYRRELVIVTDILEDPLWADYRDLATRHALRACWSEPILSSDGAVLGSFAMYYRDVRSPSYEERELIGVASQLAGIAIERHRAQEALRRSAEAHEEERRAAEARLQQSQKMEAIGRLAGGVAHDFNNLLAVITGHCELLQRDLQLPRAGHPRVAQIRRAAERAAELTHQLLAFSRKQVLAPRIVALNGIVTQVEPMLRRLIGEDIQLVMRLADDLGNVRVDPGQLEQVIVNLAVNARDAMPTGGQLTFETTNVELAKTPTELESRPGPYVMLAASDTGCGMDAETRAHIFEPFFTTKDQGKGTGLGLATVYGIIDQSGGLITVDSEPGRGARFEIYLPQVEDAGRAAPALYDPAAVDHAPEGGTETILLVEDDEPLRALLTEILCRGGYTVLACAAAEEALETGERHPGTIDLLLTDVVIPRMSGRLVAERLAERRPDMRILYISGYTDDKIVHHGVQQSATHFLSKPFSPDVVLGRIRQVLSAGRP